jgi:hypothetical protein
VFNKHGEHVLSILPEQLSMVKAQQCHVVSNRVELKFKETVEYTMLTITGRSDTPTL